LALSPKAYNSKVGLVILCPITSKEKGYPFEVPIPKGLSIQGVVLSDQVINFDWKSRKIDFIDLRYFGQELYQHFPGSRIKSGMT